MTQEEKHTLIADKLDRSFRDTAWPWVGHGLNGEYAQFQTKEQADRWLKSDKYRQSVRFIRQISPPDYSSSLDLCAQFEKRIAEMEFHAERYVEFLHGAIWIDHQTDRGWRINTEWRDFCYATATPQQRVDAAVAMIQDLGL